MTRAALLVGILLLAGCTPTLDALADDKAPVCLKWTWVYGSGSVSRYHGCDASQP